MDWVVIGEFEGLGTDYYVERTGENCAQLFRALYNLIFESQQSSVGR